MERGLSLCCFIFWNAKGRCLWMNTSSLSCLFPSSGTPVVTQSPDASVMEGETMIITCCWTAEYERMTVNWLKNQTQIHSEVFENKLPPGSLQKETSNCTNLTISSIRREDSGRYTCKLTMEIPVYTAFEGNGTVITVKARENTTDNITGGRWKYSSLTRNGAGSTWGLICGDRTQSLFLLFMRKCNTLTQKHNYSHNLKVCVYAFFWQDGHPRPNSLSSASLAVISLAVVAPLLLIILAWFCNLLRRQGTQEIVLFPYFSFVEPNSCFLKEMLLPMLGMCKW